MTDHNYTPNNMHLYHELKNLFPSASPNMLTKIINKNGYHRQRCIEELYLCLGGQYNLPSQVDNFNLHQSQYPTDNRQQSPNSGARSRSVSGVPGASSAEEARGYGYGYPNMNQGRGRSPQSAPVIAGRHSPFSPGSGFSFSNSGSSEIMNSGNQAQQYASTISLEPGLPFSSAGPTSILRSSKTTNHFEQPHQLQPPIYSQYPSSGDGMRQQHSFYPELNEYYDGMPSPSSQPVRHTTTLNVIPGSPHLKGNFLADDNAYRFPPPYGWSPSLGTHSTSVNLQLGPPPNDSHPKVQITTSGNMNYATGNAMPGGNVSPWTGGSIATTSPHPNVPYQSQLRISISPNGGSISAMRSQLHPPMPLSPARYSNQISTDRHSPVNVGFNPTYTSSPGSRLSTSSQASPRTSPKFPEENFTKVHSIFDQDDPEQEKVTHAPLKPVPSPGTIPSWNMEPIWPKGSTTTNSLAPPNELCSGEAYSQALLTHQQQKFCTLQHELDREKAQLQNIRRDVASFEFHFFQQVHCKDQMFFSFDDLQRLRSEVRSLMADCACMTRLVDLLHRGEVPLGETNEEFYKTINTGQQGPVLPNARPGLQVASPPTLHEATSLPMNWSRPSMPLPPATPPEQQHPPPSQDATQSPGTSRQPPAPPQQQDDDEEGQKWACCTCTFHNNPAMVICEMCEMPKFVQGMPIPLINPTDVKTPCYCHHQIAI